MVDGLEYFLNFPVFKSSVTPRRLYMSGFDKSYLQVFQVRFNNLTREVNEKHLKVLVRA